MSDDRASDLRRLAEQDESLAASYDEANSAAGLPPLIHRALEDAARHRRFLAEDLRRRADAGSLQGQG